MQPTTADTRTPYSTRNPLPQPAALPSLATRNSCCRFPNYHLALALSPFCHSTPTIPSPLSHTACLPARLADAWRSALLIGATARRARCKRPIQEAHSRAGVISPAAGSHQLCGTNTVTTPPPHLPLNNCARLSLCCPPSSCPCRPPPTHTAAARRTPTASAPAPGPKTAIEKRIGTVTRTVTATRTATASTARAPSPASPALRAPKSPRRTLLRAAVACGSARRRSEAAPRPRHRRHRPSRTRWPSCPRWSAEAPLAPTTRRASVCPTPRCPRRTPRRASTPATTQRKGSRP